MRMKRKNTAPVSVLLCLMLTLGGCGGTAESPGSSAPGSASETGTTATEPAGSISEATAAAPASSPDAPGEPVTSAKQLYGSWAIIGEESAASEDVTIQKTYGADDKGTLVLTFDEDAAHLTRGQTSLTSGGYEVKDGVLTMWDSTPNSLPAVYEQMRIDGDFITCAYTSGGVAMTMTWQKVSK